MSDINTGVEVGDSDVANLLSFLLGGTLSEFRRDSGAAGAMFGGPGVLRRLLQSYQGDPVGALVQPGALAAATRLTVPDEANSLVFSVEANSVRMTVDGTTPTTTIGLLLTVGPLYTLTGRATLQAAQFIQAAGGALIMGQFFT